MKVVEFVTIFLLMIYINENCFQIVTKKKLPIKKFHFVSNFSTMKVVEFVTIFLLLIYSILIKGEKVNTCADRVFTSQLCTTDSEYSIFNPPKPWPLVLNPMVDIKDVIDIDEEKQTINLYIYMSLSWTDDSLKVISPPGTRYVHNQIVRNDIGVTGLVIQGDPNQKLQFEMAIALKVRISDPMLVQPKWV